MSASSENKIAKNTLLLYFRMFIIMGIQLYTSSVVLNTLGVVDYGLYNVVGGIVTMLAFINGALITSTQRYITYELGTGNFERLQQVFTTCVQIHFLMNIVIVFLAETIGLWFLYEKMVIPDDRFMAAFWVYQLSIVTMVIKVLSIPYNSAIIAHEKMSVFAYISIFEAVAKLAVVYLLKIGDFDKLILYAILTALVQLIVRIMYSVYCTIHFAETKLIKYFNPRLIKEIGLFTGWNIWGSLSASLSTQGVNLLLNVFFGPAVNAARGVAVQVEHAIAQFSTSFLMAVNPQITKRYAQNKISSMHNLIFRASKLTFYLMLIISLPFFFETDFILKVWLRNVPDYSTIFLRLLLFSLIIESVAKPLMTAASATGRVKVYQSVVGGTMLLIIPVAYIALKLGCDPASVYIVQLVITIIAFIVRLIIVKPLIMMSIKTYFHHVILNCLIVLVVSLIIPFVLKQYFDNSVLHSLIMCAVCVISTALSVWFVGMDKKDRLFVVEKIKSRIGR